MHDPQQVVLAKEKPFRLGGLRVEPSRRLLVGLEGAERSIEPRVMQVLVVLAKADGGVVSRDVLLARCWNGRVVSEDALERVIAQLRRLAHEPGGDSFAIETIARVGYRFIGEVTEEAAKYASASSRVLFGRRQALLGTAVVSAGAILGTALWWRRSGTARPEGPLTLAVLPFTAAGETDDLETLAKQTSDELRAHLSRNGELRVITEMSSRAAVNEGGSVRAVARRLEADLIVEGQLSASPAGFRVITSLIDPREDRQVWSEVFQGAADRIGEIRLSLAGAVMQQIAGLIPVSAGTTRPPISRPDPRAHALVLEANRLLDQVRAASMTGSGQTALDLGDRATLLAEQAHAIDPHYSGAFLVLAVIARNGWNRILASRGLTTEQRVQQSIAYVRRALLADPSDPAALTQLGDYYRRFEFRWDEAESLFRRALEHNPSLVDAHWSYSYLLGTTGHAIEGLAHSASVFELDPRNPFRRIALPRLLYVLGRRAAAMRRYDIELAQQPTSLFLLRELQFMFLAEGNAEALASLIAKVEQQWRGSPAPTEVRQLAERIRAAIAALQGSPARLKAMIDADLADYDSGESGPAAPQGRARDDLPFIFAIEYAWVGEVERSLDMLERALTAKSLYWPATLPFGIAPFPAPVRNHPRFAALWQRDPGLLQLVARRRRALFTGQMAGYTPDGRRHVPVLPAVLATRVRSLLSR